MSNSEIPVIDISGFYSGDKGTISRIASEIDRACRHVGFYVVTGHGVPQEIIDSARGSARKFFNQPTIDKEKCLNAGNGYRGYYPMKSDALASSLDKRTPPDLREVFAIGATAPTEEPYYKNALADYYFAPNIWPEIVPELRKDVEAYYSKMGNLADTLLQLSAVALKQPMDYFADKIDRHVTIMSMIHYPPQRTAPLEGQIRSGEHYDYVCLTLLQRDDAPGGLEVKIGDRWVAVPYIPGSFVINVGDLLHDWTGGEWLSNLHRVANPPLGADADRISIAYFFQPNYDVVIVPVAGDKSKRIASGEHVLNKINKAMAQEPAATES